MEIQLQKNNLPSKHGGFTLIETLTVLAIAAILSALTYGVFVSVNQSRALRNDSTSLLLLLGKARSLTLGSKDNNQYGIHFEPSSMTLFKGPVYSVSDSLNIITTLHSQVQISTNLSGGGADILFNWLTGETSQSGTVKLTFNSSPVASSTVTIYGTGLAE